MRIALISPYSTGPIRGNIVTVDRISTFLRQTGVEVLVLPADTLSVEDMELRLGAFAPQLIHAFHASYCGGIARYLSTRFNVPFIITITGSDLHDPLLRGHIDTAKAIEDARTVVCFNSGEASELSGYFPRVADRIVVISQGVEQLPVTAANLFGLKDNEFVLLLPAAVRPVKQIEFPIQALADLRHRFPAIRLIIAGGIIDHDYAAAIRNMLRETPYAVWLGEVPRAQMGDLYARADVVLNCSRFESMPNTLLEAMALGRAVLAVDIPANRAIIENGNTGLLYRDTESFQDCVTRLAEDPELRANLGKRAGEFMRDGFSPENEAKEYIRLYRSLIASAEENVAC